MSRYGDGDIVENGDLLYSGRRFLTAFTAFTDSHRISQIKIHQYYMRILKEI